MARPPVTIEVAKIEAEGSGADVFRDAIPFIGIGIGVGFGFGFGAGLGP